MARTLESIVKSLARPTKLKRLNLKLLDDICPCDDIGKRDVEFLGGRTDWPAGVRPAETKAGFYMPTDVTSRNRRHIEFGYRQGS